MDEAKTLLDYLSDRKSLEREYLLMNLVLNTGLRISEVYSLNVGDVVNKKKLEIIGKGQKVRYIPLNAVIRRHIENFLKWKHKKGESLDSASPLFISRNNNRLSIRAMQRAFDKVLRAAAIDTRYSFHALRHTFATFAYRATGNIRTIQELLGHSRLDTTMVYTYVSEEDKQQTVDALAEAYKEQNTALER